VNGEAKHPVFSLSDVKFDISHDFMLVKLAGAPLDKTKYPPVEINRDPTVPRAPASSAASAQAADDLSVVGWGTTDTAGTILSDVLKEVELKYVPNNVCEQSEGNLTDNNGNLTYASFQGFIEPNMMCAFKANEDACLGDSGGPLLKLGSNGQGKDDVQVGIVSFGVGCAHPDFPGIYARVSNQAEWIDHVVCAMSDDPPADFNCPGPPTASPTDAPTDAPTSSPAAAAMDVTGRDVDDETDGDGTGNGNGNRAGSGGRRKRKPGRGRKRNKNKNKNKQPPTTAAPSSAPPTSAPATVAPTFPPTSRPSSLPSSSPSSVPSLSPSSSPSAVPTSMPTNSSAPSSFPTREGGGTASVSTLGAGAGGGVFLSKPDCHAGLYWDCAAETDDGAAADAAAAASSSSRSSGSWSIAAAATTGMATLGGAVWTLLS